MKQPAPPIALTMGEPAGIGGEIALKAWQALRDSGPCFFLIDDPERLGGAASDGVPIRAISNPSEAGAAFASALPVLPLRLAHLVEPGRPDPRNAAAVIASIEAAVRYVQSGGASALVTNPIQKSALYEAGFTHPGHTEFLAALAGNAAQPVMMLASPLLRVVPVTIHVSLRDALGMLNAELIADRARRTDEALRRDFGIAAPHLAIAGLNPHAGENGAMGHEEAEIIEPAIAILKAEGLSVSGPYPPDTMFTERMRATYDAAICMYHDQALIPLKALDMDGGVNVTLGLPFVRTSPDHGTALGIAGRGVADPGSLIAAIRMAHDMASRRAGRN